MGVDITGYKSASFVRERGEDEDWDDDLTYVYKNDDFPNRADELVQSGLYDAEYVADLGMAYSSYNFWRDELARISGWPSRDMERVGARHCCDCWEGKEGPFSELINFSDCEGAIGAAVSAKLARDFAQFQEKAIEGKTPDFPDRYAKMRTIFEGAAQGGFVIFN